MTVHIERMDGKAALELLYDLYLVQLPPAHLNIRRNSMLNSTRVWIGRDDDNIVVVWGLIPPTILSDRAYLWMFHTPHLASHAFLVARHSRDAIHEALAEFPLIIGHCSLDNLRSHRWLRWLGAEFLAPEGDLIPFRFK
jgi:hypothetical protein